MTQTDQTAPRRYSVREAATLLGLSDNSIYAHIRAGNLNAVRLGRKIIILGEEIDRVLKQGTPTVHPSTNTKPPADPLG